MRYLVLILLLGSFFGCSGQEVSISSIERKVYVNDTLHSFTTARFKDANVKSEEIIKSLDSYALDTLKKENKYIEYQFTFTDSSKRFFKIHASHHLFQIDNFITTHSANLNFFDRDETFEVNWWYKEDEIETIVIPSSEFHK